MIWSFSCAGFKSADSVRSSFVDSDILDAVAGLAIAEMNKIVANKVIALVSFGLKFITM